MLRPYVRGEARGEALTYDPLKHHRRSVRLEGFDYAGAGTYFVTIVVRNRECLLGEVAADGALRLNGLGQLVQAEWEALPARFPRVALEAYVIMPNHMHGLIVLAGAVDGDEARIDDGGRGEASATSAPDWIEHAGADASPLREAGSQRPGGSQRPRGTQAGSLGAMVQNFKSVSTRRANALRQTPGTPFWQRNYWEHVVRGEADLAQILAYIETNPARWLADQLHPAAASVKREGRT